MGEIVFIISLIGGLVLPFIFLTGIGRRYWLGLMVVIGGLLGLTEIVAKVHTGGTISQHFWHWSVQHRETAWLVLFLLAFGWLSLLVHLGWKLVFDPEYTKKFKK